MAFSQMGGDVVVSSDGSIRYLYRSIESVDRPKPDDILKALGYQGANTDGGAKDAKVPLLCSQRHNVATSDKCRGCD